jgi:glycosyltransferase involved in cell wall biosynthesis
MYKGATHSNCEETVSRKVMFFAPNLGQGGADRVLLTLLQRLDRICFQPLLVLVRAEGPWLSEVPNDVPVVTLGSRRLATSVRPLARLIRDGRFDAVVSLQGGANMVAVAAHVLARSTARLILSERSVLRRPDRSKLRDLLESPAKRVLYRRADVVTALSRGVASQLERELHIPASRVRVIYNPMVDAQLETQAAAPLDHSWFAPDAREPVVLAVGRLVEIKDYPTLLAAFSRVRRRVDARLVVLGEGRLKERLVALAHELGISHAVAFAGFDPNPFRYMRRAALLVHASRAEGLGSVLIQAAACGTPIVATDCEVGPREIITDGVDGYLVPVGDADAMARRMLDVLENRELASRMSRTARENAQRFSVAAAVAQFEDAITGR